MNHVIQNCIDWNAVEMERAERDYTSAHVMVPRHAVKVVGKVKVPLTRDEYREQRCKDAHRYSGNIETLRRAA